MLLAGGPVGQNYRIRRRAQRLQIARRIASRPVRAAPDQNLAAQRVAVSETACTIRRSRPAPAAEPRPPPAPGILAQQQAAPVSSDHWAQRIGMPRCPSCYAHKLICEIRESYEWVKTLGAQKRLAANRSGTLVDPACSYASGAQRHPKPLQP